MHQLSTSSLHMFVSYSLNYKFSVGQVPNVRSNASNYRHHSSSSICFHSYSMRSNVVLSQRAKHVKVFECSNEHDLDGSSIIRLLRELVVDDTPQRFTIHAGQSRARRIYGRSIMSRFSTAAKAESVCDPGAKPSISSSPHGDTSGGWEK